VVAGSLNNCDTNCGARTRVMPQTRVLWSLSQINQQ
jgi:hypothetical protein